MPADLKRLDRTIHLIDLENLAGTPSLTPQLVARVREAYEAIAHIADEDQVVVATAHYGALSAWFGWPDARRLVASGPDGADHQLLAVVDNEKVADRFPRVVIGSGDGIFATSAARLQEREVTVSVVSRANAVSRRLRLAVRDVRHIEQIRPQSGAAAQAA
jgi:hypothetical protein